MTHIVYHWLHLVLFYQYITIWSHKALSVLGTHAPDGRHHGELDGLVLGEHLLLGDPGQGVQAAALQDQAAGHGGEAEPGQTWALESH